MSSDNKAAKVRNQKIQQAVARAETGRPDKGTANRRRAQNTDSNNKPRR